ncbi:MAG: T9SS type A sorting domain-containing protein, partial [Bacteroidales bacterium]|nr:T9SS type A sorting domain-containing protein [Bacteroidales bacterium]
EITIEINNGDVGQPDFQVCLYLDGNMYNIDYWYIDDLWLFNPLNIDGALATITTPEYVNGPADIKGIAKNLGSSQINSLDINWQVDNGDINSTSFTGLALDFGDTYEFTCDGIFEYPFGAYELKIWIVNVNGAPDEDPSNDEKIKTINVVSYIVSYRPCFEEFTSSTCSPCAGFNAQFDSWNQQNADDLTLIKYQMDWPGSGDPYYTAEGGVRRNYYGVSWVPWLNMDGAMVASDIGAIQQAFDAALQRPGLVDVVCSHTLNGTVMDFEFSALPFAAFNDFRVHIIVFEVMTTQNVGSNGETEFHHVMMKMVPDADGTTVNLSDRVPHTINETIDLNGTNVEEWDDLGVIVIVQDFTSKVIYQSDYSVEDGVFATEARLNSLSLDGTPVAGFDPDVLVYDIELPAGTVEVPVAEAVAMDPNAIVIVDPALELPGTTKIDVFAEDLATYKTYEVNFTVISSIPEEVTEAVSVYPNPTSGNLNISGAKDSEIVIYDITGKEMAVFSDFSGEMLDLSNFEAGIYIIRITVENKAVLNKKITIQK